MDTLVTQQEQKNKRRGMITSMIVHILLILLALWPFLELPDPPPGQEGILVNLGLPDIGQGDDNAAPAEQPEVEEQEDAPEETVEEEDEPVEEPEEEETPEEPTKSEPTPTKEVITDDNSEEIRLKKEEEKRKKQEAKEKAEREAKEKARKEAEAKKKAEEAKKKAEANKLKDELSGLFGDGDGKGKTGKPGNQGDPDGDPNADKLDGISTGSGRVGGGLSGRGVLKAHTPKDNSQETGTVVVAVCVNQSGKVISAKVKINKSVPSAKLQRIAEKSALQWKFKQGELDRQCGEITYNFKLK